MKVARVLVSLYPGPLRDRWGAAMEAEASDWRSWPDLVRGVGDGWLHPMIWPADSAALRRRRAAATVVAVAFVCWLIGHFVAEQETLLPGDLRHAWPFAGNDVFVLLGLALLAPLPRLNVPAATEIAIRAVRLLAPPAILGAVVVLVAHLNPVPEPCRFLTMMCWWTALVLGAIQGCRVIAGIGADVGVQPGPLRLTAGICVLVVALATQGTIILGSSAAGGQLNPLLASLGLVVLLLVSTFAATLRDLWQLG